MKTERSSEKFVQNLLLVLPSWHSKLVRPFKDSLQREMSLETYYCLETLRMCGTVKMSELAKSLKVSKQQATKLVEALSEHGFVDRVSREDDRRAVWICLTGKAVSYLEEYHRKNTAFIESLEERLSGEELDELNDAVETLAKILPLLN